MSIIIYTHTVVYRTPNKNTFVKLECGMKTSFFFHIFGQFFLYYELDLVDYYLFGKKIEWILNEISHKTVTAALYQYIICRSRLSQDIIVLNGRKLPFFSCVRQAAHAAIFLFSTTLVYSKHSLVSTQRIFTLCIVYECRWKKKNAHMYWFPYDRKERPFASIRYYLATNGIYLLIQSGGHWHKIW